jgi:hypothetical protein
MIMLNNYFICFPFYSCCKRTCMYMILYYIDIYLPFVSVFNNESAISDYGLL